eukprot:2508264-Rhodomonas_salina.2
MHQTDARARSFASNVLLSVRVLSLKTPLASGLELTWRSCRLLYECGPMSMICEEAGGRSSFGPGVSAALLCCLALRNIASRTQHLAPRSCSVQLLHRKKKKHVDCSCCAQLSGECVLLTEQRLVEQDVKDIQPVKLHQRCPIFMGSKEDVDNFDKIARK